VSTLAPGALPEPQENGVPLDLPYVELPRVPDAGLLFKRTLGVVLAVVVLYLLDAMTFVFYDYWLLDSLGFSEVFWTNFRMGAGLFIAGFVAFGAAMIVPAYVHKVGALGRRIALFSGLILGSLAGYWLAAHYLDFLLMFNPKDFGRVDQVFGLDFGFYVFVLHGLWDIFHLALWASIAALTSSVICSYAERSGDKVPSGMSRVATVFGRIASPCTLYILILVGVITASGILLSRYDMLTRNNSKKADATFYSSGVFQGATYVDVTGLFSTLNTYYITALIALAITGTLFLLFRRLNHAARGLDTTDWRVPVKKLGLTLAILLGIDFAFMTLVSLRQLLFVTPNQPVIQLEYIQRHIDATRYGYNLENIEHVSFLPKDARDPLPKVEDLLKDPALKNAPLWPGFSSWIERMVDPQHSKRVLQTQGDVMVYGPTQQIFQAQQKLRPYYNFLDVDMIRYKIDGETKMLVTSAREVPLVEPQPWLAWWGQQFMLFTHGHGLVIAPAAGIDSEGEPIYLSSEVPSKARIPALEVNDQRIYYGEGSGTMAYSNVKNMTELDYPTEEGRATNALPADAATGVKIDSFIKRLVFGWRSGQFFEIVFSDLITGDTHVHYWRTPVERIERVAPFLYFDSDPFAFVADKRILWMVNAMTTTIDLPYSKVEELGDKSDERTGRYQGRANRWVNYVRDSVKCTVDAATGHVKLYKIADEPVADTWASIYPNLFTPGSQMPQSVRDQLQYPTQLFHIQFDDMYFIYQMKDAMTFFNMEDMWDDGDEVLGAMIDKGKAITFSNEPYPWVAQTGGLLPKSKSGEQYVLSMIFTPEKALNLRAIPTVYQDGEDYGRLVCLTVPKGHFYLGPEQADAAMDQDPDISQQFGWWQRMGTDVIRGHTSALVVQGEVLYIEPIFIRSQQNPVPQLKKVIIVFRGHARMGDTLKEALELAMKAAAKAQASPAETKSAALNVSGQ
jgi:hypothetical protein